jgi:hypothetical protein
MTTLAVDRLALFQRLFLLIAGVWVGSLFAVGFLVVPTIFTALQDRQVAGMIAAAIFQVEAYLSVLVCLGLLILANLLVRRKVEHYRSIRWITLVLLLCSLLTCFRFNSVHGRATSRGTALGCTGYGIALRKPLWALAWHFQWAVFNAEPLGSLDGVAFKSSTNKPLIDTTRN